MTESQIYNLLFNGGNYSRHYLVKLTHPDIESPICLVNNNEEVEFDGDIYHISTFNYTKPNLMGEGGSLEITGIDNDLIEFIENADYRYSLQVVGVLNANGSIEERNVYQHLFGSVTMDQENNITFSLGKDDRLDMKFTVKKYDTETNPGNA